jgi:hypothetical protein
MPGPWLPALKTVPWGAILKRAPALLAAADAVLLTTRRKGLGNEAAGDIQTLKQRIADLEEHQRAHAELVKQIADQLDAVALAAQLCSVRVRQILILTVVGLALALAACVLAWVR